jgi:hypothetical protein
MTFPSQVKNFSSEVKDISSEVKNVSSEVKDISSKVKMIFPSQGKKLFLLREKNFSFSGRRTFLSQEEERFIST